MFVERKWLSLIYNSAGQFNSLWPCGAYTNQWNKYRSLGWIIVHVKFRKIESSCKHGFMRQWTTHRWFRQWLFAWPTPSHYLNQWWNIANWALKNKLQWKFNRSWFIFTSIKYIWKCRFEYGVQFVSAAMYSLKKMHLRIASLFRCATVTEYNRNACPGPRLNIKTVLSTYGDFHVKDKTAVRTSYL